MGNLLKIFKVPERSKIENTTVPGSETYPDVEQMIPGGKKPDIPGYSLEEVIFESSSSRIWRGKRQSDGLLVLIKGASSSEQSAQEQAEIIHEHEISRNLEIDGVLRPLELVACESGSALIMENTNCLPLRKLMDQARLDLLDSLKVAVSLTSTLKEVHQQGIIHKMINPLNIFVDPALGTVKLTCFGQASRLSREKLPYISPEQSGRMNHPLDYRSDFYSLGATLYELFTGKVPFESREDIEIIHGHIARQPLSLDKIEPQVPKILSRLVLKLMGKRTDERYQVHSALLNDLLICVKQLENHGHISEFPLAQLDIPKELQIAPGLYGREDEIAELETVLERVSQGGTEMVLVSGTAGVGKTSLVGEIQRSIAQKNSFFISGKFDQLRHNIPYSALIQGLRKLIREVSVGGKSVNESWKSRMLAALGTSGHLMNQVIPELEQIIGPQPPLPEK